MYVDVHPRAEFRLPPKFSRAWRFQTFSCDAQRRARTCGVVVASRDFDLTPAQLRAIAPAASFNPASAARGKLAIVAPKGAQINQIALDGTSEVAWCGNAVAPAAIVAGDGRNVRIDVFGPNGRKCVVDIEVHKEEVRQWWTVGIGVIGERTWRGRRVILANSLNPYAIVLGSLPDGVSPNAARIELVGDALNTKVAVIAGDAIPTVQFFNANGQHGAAPLTGLATLAIVAHADDTVRSLIPQNTIAYATAAGAVVERLPHVVHEGLEVVRVEMPITSVELHSTEFQQ